MFAGEMYVARCSRIVFLSICSHLTVSVYIVNIVNMSLLYVPDDPDYALM